MIRINQGIFTPINERHYELVERKGLSHPDTLCDGVMEEISKSLSCEYLKEHKKILHHNVDKGLICGGATIVEYGGGEFIAPIFIVLGGRATSTNKVDAQEVALDAAWKYLKKTTRFLREDNVEIRSKISHGAPELQALLKPRIPLSNDTSVCTGFAPQSELEKIVLKVEETINSRSFKAKYPEVGEDVKIMGYRKNNEIQLTVAAAFVSKFIKSLKDYHAKKKRLAENIEKIAERLTERRISITVNKADRGKNVYLTLTGLSAEMGDDGNTGRGNRVNGLITPCRPMAIESAAGKNPVCHVGKIYSILAFQIAEGIVKLGAKECNVYLQSQIGTPINKPAAAIADIIWDKEKIKKNEKKIQRIFKDNLNSIPTLTKRIIDGKIRIF